MGLDEPGMQALTQRGELELPYGDLPDLTAIHSESSMQQLLARFKPDAPPETLRREADNYWKILGAMEKEDIFVIPYAGRRHVALAQIIRPYLYRTEDGRDIHTAEIQWLNPKISRMKLGSANHAINAAQGLRLMEHAEDRRPVFRLLDRPFNRFRKMMWLLKLIIALNMIMLAIRMVKNP